MAALESEAYFDGRMTAMRMSMATATTLKTRGLTTLSDFAFSTAYIPGQGDDAAFVDGLLPPLMDKAMRLMLILRNLDACTSKLTL